MSDSPTTVLRLGIVCYPTFGGSGVVATELGKACRSTIAGLPPHVVEGMPIEQTVKEMIAVIQQAKQTACTGLNVDGEPFPW